MSRFPPHEQKPDQADQEEDRKKRGQHQKHPRTDEENDLYMAGDDADGDVQQKK